MIYATKSIKEVYDEKFIFSSNITPVVINPPARHPILWYLWFEHALPKAIKKQKVDVFFSPDGYLSLKTNIPTVLSIHDLAFEVFPKQIPFLVAKYYTFFTPKFAKKAAQIVAVSTSTKNDLIRFYGIEEKKITVVSNGCSAQFNPVPSNIKEEIKNKWTEGHPFFIFIGAMHPRKNIEGIFKAFDLEENFSVFILHNFPFFWLILSGVFVTLSIYIYKNTDKV